MMNFKKATLAVALSAIAVSAYAEPETTVYGKAHFALEALNTDDFTNSQIGNFNSRIGIKGFDQINDDLKVIFVYEMAQKGDDEANGAAPLSARNTYAGFEGNFGQIVFGRNDTRLKASQGKLDLFNDTGVDIKHLFEGEDREGDTVTYTTPSLSGVKFAVTHVMGQDYESGGDGQSVSVTYGDSGLKKGNLYAAVAVNNNVDERDVVRVSGQYKLGDIKIGGMYQTEEKTDGTDKGTGMMINAVYKMGDYNLEAQYQMLDADADAAPDPTSITVGIETKLAKSTKAYAFLSMQSDVVAADVDSQYGGVAFEYKF